MFREIPPHVSWISQLGSDNAFGIDENRSPEAGTCRFIQHPVGTADDLCPVTDHRERHIFQ